MADGTNGCTGSICAWVNASADGNGNGSQLTCEEGTGNCVEPKFLEAEPSDFHDQTLIEATAKIKNILAGIPKDPQGRRVSLVHTNMGTLLAWVHHSATPSKKGVTATDDDATVAKALKLKGVPAGGA